MNPFFRRSLYLEEFFMLGNPLLKGTVSLGNAPLGEILSLKKSFQWKNPFSGGIPAESFPKRNPLLKESCFLR